MPTRIEPFNPLTSPLGTLEATYRFTTLGMSLSAPAEAVSPGGSYRVTLVAAEPNGLDLRVVVTLRAASLSAALGRAQAVVDAVYSRFLLGLSQHLALTSRPALESYRFRSEEEDTITAGHAAGGAEARGVGQALLSPELVQPVLDRALLEVETGQLPTSAGVYSARSMLSVAMEATDPVVSYLVCFTALSLAALFRLGRDPKSKRAPGQSAVEQLLITEDPTITQRPVLKADGHLSNETAYTEARNAFIHAEERGEDPSAAMAEMRRLLPDFRRLTAAILSKL